MANTDLQTKEKVETEDRTSLKGTLFSVFFLGIFIVVSWLGVYYLFLDRF